ncbi:MAG: hypothetical protein FWB96_09170 [Defluviitaleaceae bacterium]|nr:hypothetical protein [Defluviitaleaceae bacterium]MCL2263391.1 hypothetical protein [Defluviitaleaceae bacterium]
MLETVTRLLREEPNVFENMQRTNAILLDLAPESPRERILVRSFVEVGGLDSLRKTSSYALEEKKLVQNIIETFCMERAAALWVVRLFGVAMGFLGEDELLTAPDVTESGFVSMERSAATYLHGQVSIGKKHVVALGADGTVFAGGDNAEFQCDVVGWTDIVAVAAGESHTLGLRADGRVLATGTNAYDECDIGHLTDVSAVYAFGNDSVCVMKDGTAQAFGRSRLDLSTFHDIKRIAKYPEGLIGIREDGKLMLVGSIADDDAALEIQWLLSCHDVEQVISTYNSGCVVLGKDKRIYKNHQPENYFTQWRDIVSIVDLADSFAILRGDGTVRVLAYERDKPRPDTAADKWSNIAAIYGGYKRLIGLTKDGNLLVAYTHQGWLWSNQAMVMDYVARWYPVGVF